MKNISEKALLFLCDALKRYPAIDFSDPRDQPYADHDLIFNIEYDDLETAEADDQLFNKIGLGVKVQPINDSLGRNVTNGKWNVQFMIFSVLDLRLITDNFHKDSLMLNKLMTECYRRRYFRDKIYPEDIVNESDATLCYRIEWKKKLHQQSLENEDGIFIYEIFDS